MGWHTPLIPTLGRKSQADICEFKAWWYMPLSPILGRQRQTDLYEFEANLVNRVSYMTKIIRNPDSNSQKLKIK